MNWSHSQTRAVRRRQTGMTLLELMVVLAVAAITLAIGVPSFQGIASDSRMTAAANNLIGALNVARSEAIKRGLSVSVTASSSSGTASWSNGGTVAVVTPAETLKSFTESKDITITNTGTEVTTFTFLPSGFVSLAAAQTLKVCDAARTGEDGRVISINVSGRINVTMLKNDPAGTGDCT